MEEKLKRIGIIATQNDPVLLYAVRELKRFMNASASLEANEQEESAEERYDGYIELAIEISLPDFSFGMEPGFDSGSGKPVLRLTGRDATGVLHAVYTFLEEMGILFDISGPVVTKRFDYDKIWASQEFVVPVVKWRGIRQHINFPMDISSYSLPDAREYIRNLARLRMNCITFHSYPGQWYDLPSGELAGNFFYGQRYPIPRQLSPYIANEDLFCIPEIERHDEDAPSKSQAAIQWLDAVMQEAKAVGLKVRFSVELRDHLDRAGLEICDWIQVLYPLIDELELITQECGTWAYPVMPARELEELIAESFGPEVLEDGAIRRILAEACRETDEDTKAFINAGIWQLPGTLKELSNHIRVANALLASREERTVPELALGLYATDHSTLMIIRRILATHMPVGVRWSLLPAHGARAVVNSLKAMEVGRELMRNCMIYSWIEFDGNMYLQQNAVKGIEQLLEFLTTSQENEQIYGISFNHWRTAENKTAAKYSSLAMIRGYIEPEEFYESYARSLGITDTPRYASAMALLDETDDQVRNRLSNIGFCFADCWWNGRLSYFGAYEPKRIATIREEYKRVLELLQTCRIDTATAYGSNDLELIANRIECTLIHLNMVEVMTQLQAVCGSLQPGTLSEAQRQEVNRICTRALDYCDKYMEHHCRILPDRGSEGTVISYYHTLPSVINKIMELYVTGSIEESKPDSHADAPPSPAI
ncbi:hypothetical protein [Cohnella sp.]|uniref:hypothetical protein n=1 Tax=Cohnella sp. TaxID=1883426 RepID=UPI0037037726